MAEKLVYQPPKWEKELKKELQLFRQSKGKDITLSNLQKILRAYPEITDVPIAPSNFAPDEGVLTRHTLCMVRKIDKVWHKICKQAVRW